MKILALDTSTPYCSLALWLDGEILCREAEVGQRHAELILPQLAELLAAGGVSLRQLDGIAYGEGPGSFTGLRIACGVAQGLSLGADLPVAGISTLLALAEGAQAEQVIACLDARMGEVYHGIYQRRDGDWQTVSPPGLYHPGDAPLVSGAAWVGCGSGFAMAGGDLHRRYAGALQRVAATLFPSARFIAPLAAPVFAAGAGRDAATAVPVYLRDKVALKTCERSPHG